MRRIDVVGLEVLLADAMEVLQAFGPHSAPPPGLAGVDLVRVESPDVVTWAALRACGFLPKPDRLTWIADSAADDDAFLARMGRKARASVRNARRWVAASGGTVRAVALTDSVLAEFLALYDDQLRRMQHGFPVAHAHRDDLRARREQMTVVQVHIDGRLAGSCIAELRSATDPGRIRFSAVTEAGREHGLAGALYAETATVLRERGVARLTLGNDPNIYGHLVQPGLFDFKRHLGFVPVPSRTVDASDGTEIADRVMSLRRLRDPSFMIGLTEDIAVREGVPAALTLHSFYTCECSPLPSLPHNVAKAASHRLPAVAD